MGKGKGNLVSMKVLTEDDTRVLAGSNRHEAIMRYAESMLRKYPDMEKNVFSEVIKAKNNLMCSPPLSESELEEQIKCASEFISRQIQKEEEIRRETKLTYGTTEFWDTISNYLKDHKPDGSYVKCVDCKNDIAEIDPFSTNHKGHKVIIFK